MEPLDRAPDSALRTTTAAPFTVVVGLDFKEGGGYAFEQAARIARAIPGSQLHLIHVFAAAPSDAARRELVDHLRLYVDEEAAYLGGLAGVTIGIHLRAGAPAPEIARLAGELRANLVMLGTDKWRHVKSALVGSLSEWVGRTAPCPVLVAGPRPAPLEHEPAILPPCPDCVHVRAATGGASFWCARHEHHHARAHSFSYQREIPMASHDSEVVPTGVSF